MASLTPDQPSGNPPTERGGWWHQYVCPAHGVELEPAGYETGEFPAGGVPCSYGCRVDTEAVRGAWRVLAHHWWGRRIRLLSHTGEGGELLIRYARLYLELTKEGEHEEAQGWMQRGRLFHQALTDAVWGVPIAHSAKNLADRGVELAECLPMLDDMVAGARLARDAMVAQDKFSSNYTAWFNALGTVAGQAAAAIRGEAWDGATEWLTGEHGQYAHLAVSTAEDGWEWENSTYYHGFVLRAYLLSLRGQDPTSVPDRLEAMISALAGIATDGGILPALHDGPYRRVPLAIEWLEIVVLARQFTEHHGLDAVGNRARAEVGPGYDGLEDQLDGWFAGPPRQTEPVDRPTVEVTNSYAVLRVDGIHALLDHGAHGGSHGHHDKLALYLYGADTPWQPDAGQVPYGHAEWRRYYQSAAAHPTIRIDNAEPEEATGVLLHHGPTSVTAEVSGWYEGVRAVRHVAAGDGYLVDLVSVEADRDREIVLQFRPDVELAVQVAPEFVRTTWSGVEVLHGLHLAADNAVPVTRPAPGPADDPQRTRTALDWTVVGASAFYCSVYHRDADALTSVRLVDGGVRVSDTVHRIGG
ncbi:heparinase II/III-like protein [Kribbella amoyensis]|uniref:Heparinase II/III-like protein n=1 Tax=Kribbella amoyensis TaxID=996641 RepID=A0A561BL28_9ACTN|nr:heparinase II/III family protein [Kribbella amoyensis]TWD79581.1 heparinase II/III-like protein [Kribbella amoyensis]